MHHIKLTRREEYDRAASWWRSTNSANSFDYDYPGKIRMNPVARIQEYIHETYDDPLYTIKRISPRVDQHGTESRVYNDLIAHPEHDECFIASPSYTRLGYPNITIKLDLCPFVSENKQEVGIIYRLSRSMILSFEYACDLKNPCGFYDLFHTYMISGIWREATSHGIAMPNEFIQACAHLQEFLRRVISHGNHFRIPEPQYIDAREIVE